jgi:hypothetical protein
MDKKTRLGRDASAKQVAYQAFDYILMARQKPKSLETIAQYSWTDVDWWRDRHDEIRKIYKRCGYEIETSAAAGVEYLGPWKSKEQRAELKPKFLMKLLAL